MGSQMPDSYPAALLDYELPPGLIPQQPLPDRDASRLMVVHRGKGTIEHRSFRELPEILEPGDFLVLNDGRVMRSRFHCVRVATGGKVEVLITRLLDESRAECLTKTRGHLAAGDEVAFDEETSFIVERPTTDDMPGIVRILQHGEPATSEDTERLLTKGELPLPLYLKEELSDEERYQTEYGKSFGSAAAPTAGLHFTERTFEDLRNRGIEWAMLTLHIGTATFLPIRSEDVTKHRLSPEPYTIRPGELRRILKARLSGRRILAVGTTSTRVLEGVLGSRYERLQQLGIADEDGLASLSDKELQAIFPLKGETGLFILPGYRFRFVGRLLTNFHLPRTTLLALVYAFGGRELIRNAYDEAVQQRYRFYSLGDAMLVL